MNEIANSFLLAYAALFPIINPVGGAPIFLSLTQDRGERVRHALARGVAVNSFFLLLGSLLVGSPLLEFFGISLPALRIAGGLVVTSLGWKLLHQGGEAEEQRNSPAADRPIDAFYPLTMPLTVGPGSISVAITLGSQRPSVVTDLARLAMLGAAAIAGLLAISLTIFFCYRFAERIVAVLGPRGTNVLIRLSAFILVCIGIQILWEGYRALVGLSGGAAG